ncbi:MAG: undecaprenyl-diphosphate phosphatase [Planctomycetaceae bacterium]|nr:undecaprenyl-diphosphate phosphatase [Planctomycetaceae bacterium]
MSYWQAIVLGVIQGIAEFLPISSSGHLVLAGSLLDMPAENMAFNVALHVGTLFSIVLVYRHLLVTLLKQPRVLACIVVATLPLVVVGLLLHDQLKHAFSSPLAAGVALCVTAGLLWTTRWIDRGTIELPDITWKQALMVGMFQAIAPIPGISRSGVTIFGGLLSGMSRQTAATFSFLIAIPAILGAATLETLSLLKSSELSSVPWNAFGVGAAVAFVVGILALKALLRVISARRLYAFGWYCLAVGLLTIAVSLLGTTSPL